MNMSGKPIPNLSDPMGSSERAERYAVTFLRLMLGAAFLNGVASVWAKIQTIKANRNWPHHRRLIQLVGL